MVRSAVRTLSFFSKWLAEVVRQPSLMLSLIVGPFLILLAFGQGVSLGVPRPRAIVVVPPEASGEERKIQPVPKQLEEHLKLVGETSDLGEARARLRRGEADIVAVLPPDPLATVKQGQRAPVLIYTNEIDPVRRIYAHAYLQDQVSSLNQQTLERAIGEAQGSAAEMQALIGEARRSVQAMRTAQGSAAQSREQVRGLKALTDRLPASAAPAVAAGVGASFVIPGLEPAAQPGNVAESVEDLQTSVDRLNARLSSAPDATTATPTAEELAQIDTSLVELDRATATLQQIPAWVLSAPFELEVENIARLVPTYISFYSPAVLALLLQHLAITLGALSMARIRLLGLMELLRASPVRPAEVAVGHYLSYGSLCAVAGAILISLIVFALGVPMFGSWWTVAGTLGLLTLCSLGIGFVISMISSSEQQAAQIAMLVLIASVFFSGFMVALDTIIWPFRAISFALPSTYAVRTLQDEMLRGVLRQPLDLIALGAGGLIFFLLTVQLFRREYRPR